MATKRCFSLLALILALVLSTGLVVPAVTFPTPLEDGEMADYIVGFDSGAVKSLTSLSADIASLGGRIEKNYGRINASKVRMTRRAAEALSNQSGISFVEPDYPVYAASQTVTWGVEKVYELEDYPFESWGSTSGQGIRVAVLDTGIDEQHEDIPVLAGGYNAIGDLSYWGTDLNGHGTHVAGIISAMDNDIGVLGVSPAIDLYAVKVLDSKGSGSISTIIDGIQWAMDNDIDIINMSLGTNEYSQALEQICADAFASGILLVAAAGNSGTIAGTEANINYPARFESVMAVTASDPMDDRAYFSSTGVQAEIMAPGVDILSTIPDDAVNSNLIVSGSAIAYMSKTVEGSGLGVVTGPMVDLGLAIDMATMEAILLDKGVVAEDQWIALIDRGTLTFSEKVSNVMALGADGAVIINDSTSVFEQETITLYATESDKSTEWIPTIFVSNGTGQEIRINDLYGTVSVGYSMYGNKSGTSMASPHVAGVAAVLWAADPTLSNADIRQVLTGTALDLELPQTHQGYGLVQLNAGLDLILSNLEPVVKEPLLLFDFMVEDKVYDGNNLAEGSFSDNRNEGDLLEFTYDVEFSDKDTGSGKIVSFSNIEITGGLDKHKYVLSVTTGQAIASINPAVLTGMPKSPAMTYGNAIPEYYIELDGFVSDEGVEQLDLFEYVIDSDYAPGMPPDTYNLTISALTASAVNYTFNITETGTFEVAPKALDLAGDFTVSNKIYDGTTSATIAENNLTLQGILDGDEVYISDVTGAFKSADIGKAREVHIVDITLGGMDAPNYTLNLESKPIAYADINAPAPPPPPPSGGGSSGGGGGGFIPMIEDDPVYAIMADQQSVDVGTVVDDESNGVSAALITLDGDKITEVISGIADVKGSRMSLSIDKDQPRIEIIMSKDIVDLLSEKQMELEVLTPIGGTIIPMNLISLEEPIKELGNNIRENRLRITLIIEALKDDRLELMEQRTRSLEMTMVAEPVEFSLIVQYGNLTSMIDRFDGYTTKLVPLRESFDNGGFFTGVLFDDQETFYHLPSRLAIINGKSYAFIRSMSHSIYTAIRNEVFTLEVDSHWSRDAVNDMISKLVITNPNDFRPEAHITRGAFADYIVKALGLHGADEEYLMAFSDVPLGTDLVDSISMAAGYGIIKGYTDGTFKPYNTITRQEAMTMYARAMDVIGLTWNDSQRILNYGDRDQVADWAYEEVSNVLNAGVFNGTSPTTISPESTFRYAEAATAIKNLLDRYLDSFSTE